MPEPIVAAPAQPEPVTPPAAPASISAIDHAVQEGNVAGFRDARRAEREGKPLPVVAAKPAVAAADTDDVVLPAPAAAVGDRPVSKRQQDVNDKIREAVDRATADLRAELARRPRTEPAAPPAPAPPNEADYKRYLAMPGAPKEADFESIFEHNAAVSLFIADKRFEEREAQRQGTERRQQFVESLEQRDRQFKERMDTAVAADPGFLKNLRPEVIALKTPDDLGPGETPGPLNDVADFILRSDMPERLMQHFSDHPDELDRFKGLTHQRDVTFEMGRLVGRLTAGQSASASAPPAVPKPITEAPPPATTLGNRAAATAATPIDNAVAARDFGAFRAERLAQRTAAKG